MKAIIEDLRPAAGIKPAACGECGVTGSIQARGIRGNGCGLDAVLDCVAGAGRFHRCAAESDRMGGESGEKPRRNKRVYDAWPYRSSTGLDRLPASQGKQRLSGARHHPPETDDIEPAVAAGPPAGAYGSGREHGHGRGKGRG